MQALGNIHNFHMSRHTNQCGYWENISYLHMYRHTSQCGSWEIYRICICTVIRVNAGLGKYTLSAYVTSYESMRVLGNIPNLPLYRHKSQCGFWNTLSAYVPSYESLQVLENIPYLHIYIARHWKMNIRKNPQMYIIISHAIALKPQSRNRF